MNLKSWQGKPLHTLFFLTEIMSLLLHPRWEQVLNIILMYFVIFNGELQNFPRTLGAIF